jgi:hypothetical protein
MKQVGWRGSSTRRRRRCSRLALRLQLGQCWRMLPATAASAAACRVLNYRGFADLIEAEQLTPQRIARLFRLSASRAAGRDCALVVLAGALGRYGACPTGWSGEQERGLALEALAAELDPQAVLVKLSKAAVRIVAEHWPEIARAA